MKVRNYLTGKIIVLPFLLSLFFQACTDEEDVIEPKNDTQPATVTASRMELTLDSLFLYAKEIYLWNEELPEYEVFNPRAYAYYNSDLENMNEELYDITQFPLSPGTGEPYEYYPEHKNKPKFSYIEESEATSASLSLRSSSPLDGTDDSFGFDLTAIAVDDIRIRFVSSNSPASEAGLKRGDKLLEVNGKSVRADSQSDVNQINNAFKQSSFSLAVAKPAGDTLETTLIKSTYTVDPVFKDTILETRAGKVGYLAYDMFSSLSNSETPLNEAFAEFATAGITDLVVDLRYNGGGYVSTAEYLCNLIAPSSLNGQVMYTQRYNEQMQAGNARILENQLLLDENGNPKTYRGRNATYADVNYSEEANTYTFSKKGTLNTIENVYFIISDETASASELVINTLKPYMNVTLIGSNSYGKPVGFFGIQIDKYTVYMSNFQTVNTSGEGNYFNGFEPDFKAGDDVSRDFGHPDETSLSIALALIEGGGIPNVRIATESSRSNFPSLGPDNGFQGMIETRTPVLK